MPPVDLSFLVHPTSGIPIYRQLLDQIRSQILGGRRGEGEYLPSVRSVADSLQINPMTVSKAYSLLEREGLVELVKGQGMRVAAMRSSSRAKSDALLPLLEQVAATARHLSLSPEQVIKQLKPLLEDHTDD
ncbi:MAG TPA: GntR family transcriptional regulator [Tepidisphaeraceae bacterium]|jgi:GntR family transcriptional regulator|nr:GntR family transcriptional regulator [Tepidisphaeraceae bacterium]